jgi:CubicO group peptidase (beta-lactamase class C family)
VRKTIKISVIVIISLLVIYFLLPKYVQRALIHLTPSIDDYKIFHNRIIEAGEYHPWEISDSCKHEIKTDSIRQRLEKYKPIAGLIIQDSVIVYEEYWEGYNSSSLSNSFSAAKSIVALLIGIALDEGKIDSLDQRVGDFLPEFSKGSKIELTIRDVLTMSSGLNWEESYSTPFSTTTEAYYGNDLNSLINNLEVVEEPGVEFSYLSGNTQVLAMVVEKATGMRISDYTSEKVWKKIGAQSDALWNLDSEDGMEKAYCCFNTNIRDFARFGQLVLNNGNWNGEQIVSEEYIKDATTPKTYLRDKETGEVVDFYGYQWWIINYKGHHIPYMRGILGQYIFAIPDKNAVIVRLGHERSVDKIHHHPQDVYDYLDAAFLVLK